MAASGGAVFTLILKGLRARGSRFVICVTGIGTSTLLVLVLLAAYRSVLAGIARYIGQPRHDLWIAPRGTDNLIRSSGAISLDTLDDIRDVPGVARLDPIVRAFVTAESHGERLTLLAIGFNGRDALGSPRVAIGAMPAKPDQIVLDRAAAHRLHVSVGDSITVNGKAEFVAGITTGTNLLATQLAFFDLSHRDLPMMSFAIVEVAHGAAAEDVARRIRQRVPMVDVISRGAFAANNVREIGSGFLPLLLLIDALGVASAALLVSFLINTAAEQRRGELAVLLAAGASPVMLGAGLALHAGELLVTGIFSGTVCAHLLSRVLDEIAPIIPLEFTIHDFIFIAALLSAAGLLASTIPIFRLKDIDPVEAFRS
jgi:putative ABC transport system permease protein